MRTKILIFIMILMIPFVSFPQNKVNNKPMIKSEHNNWTTFTDSDFYEEKGTNLGAQGYILTYALVDSAKILPMIRETISPQFLEKINKQTWVIHTRVSSYGVIVGVSFSFHDASGVNTDELAILSERIRNEIKYKLRFNKEVTDLFYLSQDILPSPYIPTYKGKQK